MFHKVSLFLAIIAVIIIGVIIFVFENKEPFMPESPNFTKTEIIQLPEPRHQSNVSIEQALLRRSSVRHYTDEPLTLAEVSQILWAVQGITIRPDGRKGRTAPSAGALYPLEVYLTVKNVDGLDSGVYHFIPEGHKLRKVLTEDVHIKLSAAALGQAWVANAPINVVIAAVYERTTVRYGDRGVRYVYMEAGHAAQNVHLQVISLDLGTVVVGAFNDKAVKKIINMADNEVPLYIMPVGRP